MTVVSWNVMGLLPQTGNNRKKLEIAHKRIQIGKGVDWHDSPQSPDAPDMYILQEGQVKESEAWSYDIPTRHLLLESSDFQLEFHQDKPTLSMKKSKTLGD